MPSLGKVLLDSSALLAHAHDENGAHFVGELLDRGDTWVAAVTWLEVYARIARLPRADDILNRYQRLAETLDVTREIVDAAIFIRRSTHPRLPSMDCLIAASARVHNLHLVHRDAHMACISQEVVAHTSLPAKG